MTLIAGTGSVPPLTIYLPTPPVSNFDVVEEKPNLSHLCAPTYPSPYDDLIVGTSIGVIAGGTDITRSPIWNLLTHRDNWL